MVMHLAECEQQPEACSVVMHLAECEQHSSPCVFELLLMGQPAATSTLPSPPSCCSSPHPQPPKPPPAQPPPDQLLVRCGAVCRRADHVPGRQSLPGSGDDPGGAPGAAPCAAHRRLQVRLGQAPRHCRMPGPFLRCACTGAAPALCCWGCHAGTNPVQRSCSSMCCQVHHSHRCSDASCWDTATRPAGILLPVLLGYPYPS